DQARQEALKSVSRFRYENNDYFYIYDQNLKAISHPDTALLNHNMADYQDIHGNYVLQEIKQIVSTSGSGFSDFWHFRLGEDEPVQKLSYNVLYPKWNWIVGTGVYIHDIDKDYDKKLQEVIDELKYLFSEIRIGETGYLFIFSGENKMLVHPDMAGEDISMNINPATGTLHSADLILASQTPEIPYAYFWNKPPRYPDLYKFKKESFVDYFQPLNWYIASSMYQDDMMKPINRIIVNQILAALLILIICLIAVYFISRHFTRNLADLTNHVRNMSTEGFPEQDRDHMQQLAFRVHDEIGELTDSFLNMENALHDYIRDLKVKTAQNEKIRSELNIARNIQLSLLPRELPESDEARGFQLNAAMRSAREVGGDLYDYFFPAPGILFFAIGDVSDKGVPAALFMARCISLLRAAVRTQSREESCLIKPDRVLTEVNDELARDNEICMFVTLFCGVIDLDRGVLNYASAGHNPPCLIRKTGEILMLDQARSSPLGWKQNNDYSNLSLDLQQEDLLFCYTDGVVEALNQAGEFYTEDKLVSLLSGLNTRYPAEVNKAVLDSVLEFQTGLEQSDDIALLCFRYKKK
ncbi:MAG: SpoIIE family protein phosphatase, partial [Candidatus Cloacimonetes bacterium]|nr:SpoIIE family protein phosphatase [Candidatus Cloacimonadota bacterium]